MRRNERSGRNSADGLHHSRDMDMNKKMTTPDAAAPMGRWRVLVARCLRRRHGARHRGRPAGAYAVVSDVRRDFDALPEPRLDCRKRRRHRRATPADDDAARIPANPRPEYAQRNAPLRPNDQKLPFAQYPCLDLIRTIVLYGVAAASLAACASTAQIERSTPHPTAAPVVTPPTPALEPAPAAKTVGLLLNEPEAFDGYTLFNKRGTKTIYLIDNQGRVVHRWELEARGALFARLLENGNLLTFASYSGRDPELSVREVDPNGDILWDCVQGSPHHDFLKMPNGNVLLLSQQDKTAEEAIAAGANPEFIGADGLWMPHIVEARITGPANCEIVWEWSAWDHLIQDFDSSKANYGVVAEHPELIDLNFRLSEVATSWKYPSDWIHTNGIDYNPELDQIVLSPRHFSEVWIIDHSTTRAEAAGPSGGKGGKGGDLLYRWGNPRAYRAGTPDDQQLFWPHNPQWIAPGRPGTGNILIFNNGWEFPDFLRGYSTVDEIAPPVDGANYRLNSDLAYAPAEPVWVYTAPTPSDFYAPYISGTQRLPNGNTLICDGVHGTLFEVTPTGKTVWKYVNPMTGNGPLRQGESVPLERWGENGRERPANEVYRAYRYAPDYPGLQGLDLTPGDRIEKMSVSDYLIRLTGGNSPVIRSDWDVYLIENSLIYKKEQCTPEDAEPTFFLHLDPVDMNDLPSHRKQYGFDNLDFAFRDHGLIGGRVCVTTRKLPDYAIAAIRTGQFTGEGRIWEGNFDVAEPADDGKAAQ